MKFIKENLLFFIVIVLISIIGGYFTTIYSLSYTDSESIKIAIDQVGSIEAIIAITVVQIAVYAIVFSAIGIILSNKIGLWKKFEVNKKAIIILVVISIIGGLLISVFDRYVFGSFLEPVRQSYEEKPTLNYIISAFTYGGVFEEILMRLFLMTLISWIIYKIFYRKEEKVPVKAIVIANIISALLFAAGHLPSTKLMFGYLDGLIIFRCFLLNGGFGFLLGWLYQKYGICYSMLAHFGAHLVSKIIWILFI